MPNSVPWREAAVRGATGKSVDLAVFVATSGHSGVDRIMGNLMPEFGRRGLRVDLLRIAGHGPYFEEAPPGVRIVDLGARHVNTAFPALLRYLRRIRPSAMLTDKDRVNRAAIVARRLASPRTRLAVRMGTTVTSNLLNRPTLDRRIQTWSMRHLYPLADAVVTPSAGAARDMEAYARLPAGHVHAIPSPVVTDRVLQLAEVPVAHPWFLGREAPVLVGVGELSERKDFATLVRAFARLRQRRPARLIILGEGRQRQALLGLARELGVAEDLDLPGFVDNPYAYMAGADVFAMSSRWEGSPVALMEAQALGVPCVACDCPSGPRETLDEGRFGVLVPVGDWIALADGLALMLDQPLPAEDLRQAGRRFSVAVSATEYLRVLGLT